MVCRRVLLSMWTQALDTPIATVDEASSVEFRIRRSRRLHGGQHCTSEQTLLLVLRGMLLRLSCCCYRAYIIATIWTDTCGGT